MAAPRIAKRARDVRGQAAACRRCVARWPCWRLIRYRVDFDQLEGISAYHGVRLMKDGLAQVLGQVYARAAQRRDEAASCEAQAEQGAQGEGAEVICWEDEKIRAEAAKVKGSFLLVLIASALLLSGASNGGSDKTHQNQTGTDNRSTNGKTNPTPPTVNIVVQPAPVQIIQPSTPVEKKQPAQKWYQRPSATDWGILAVTLFYTLISLGLLDATRRQAILAKAAAEAAKESADIARRALTVLEVPYVSIYDIVPHVLRTHGTQEGPRPNAVIWFEYNLKNHGRSVAEVTAVHGELRIMDNLPIPPDYNGIIDQSAFAIGPNSDTGKVRWTVSYKFPTDNVDEEFESISGRKETPRVFWLCSLQRRIWD